VQDGPLSAVIIGEAKSGHFSKPKEKDLLSETDLQNLERVLESIRNIGIDCWVVFATSRPKLEESEVGLLRKSSERGLVPLARLGSTYYPVVPIALTDRPLSVGPMSPQHPSRLHQGFPCLPGMAVETCRKEIGLERFEPREIDGTLLMVPKWVDTK
jgi:hypothetical protein